MKVKITNALKTEYATLGLGEKAFDGVASFLAKTVTDESQIAEAVKADEVRALLKGFQGETDSLRGKAAQLQRDFDAYRAGHPDTTVETAPAQAPGTDVTERLEARLAEMERKMREAEARAATAAQLTSIRSRLERDCKDAPILRQVLKGYSPVENETEDQAVTRLTAEYNETVREIRGEGYVPPMGGGYQPAAYKGGDFSDEVARLRAEGKLPQANS